MKKHMKKGIIFLLALTVLFAAAGCRKKEAEPEEKVKKKKTQTEEQQEVESPLQAVGNLVKYTENTITIKQNDGKELTFNSNNCKHEFKNGLREGNWIVVTYTGKINGTDTKGVKVLKITDNDENIIQKEQKKMNIKAVSETVYCTADNVHVRESYSTASKIVGTVHKGDKIQRTGICDNGWSRINYNGADAYVYGDYLSATAPAQNAAVPEAQAATQVQVPAAVTASGIQVEAPAPVRQAEPSDEQKTVEGTVVEVSMNTLTFSADGVNYTVYIADAVHNYEKGIQAGNKVTIVYTGDLADLNSVTVISVTDTDPSTSAQNAVYVGVVLDASMNTLMIQTDDGAEMTFSKMDAVDNTGGLMVDMRVSVTADTNSADDSTHVLPARQIDPL